MQALTFEAFTNRSVPAIPARCPPNTSAPPPISCASDLACGSIAGPVAHPGRWTGSRSLALPGPAHWRQSLSECGAAGAVRRTLGSQCLGHRRRAKVCPGGAITAREREVAFGCYFFDTLAHLQGSCGSVSDSPTLMSPFISIRFNR